MLKNYWKGHNYQFQLENSWALVIYLIFADSWNAPNCCKQPLWKGRNKKPRIQQNQLENFVSSVVILENTNVSSVGYHIVE